MEISKGKFCNKVEAGLTQLKINLFQKKGPKELFFLFSNQTLTKLVLNESDLQNSKCRTVFRMNKQLIVDYKIVDIDHVLIMYQYQIVLVNLRISEEHEQLWGNNGTLIPLNTIKLTTEQEGIYLAPNFDFNRNPLILVRENQGRDQQQE